MTYGSFQDDMRYLVFIPIFFLFGLSLHNSAIASDEIEISGDILQIVIPAVAYGATFYLDDREARPQFYKSFSTNLALTYGLKLAVDKNRPNGHSHSFPSGHTSTAFVGASFIHLRYGLKYAIPAYLGASWVGYSRIESDNHYAEDVLAGAAIGVISSLLFTKRYKGFTITPTAENGAYSIRISKEW